VSAWLNASRPIFNNSIEGDNESIQDAADQAKEAKRQETSREGSQEGEEAKKPEREEGSDGLRQPLLSVVLEKIPSEGYSAYTTLRCSMPDIMSLSFASLLFSLIFNRNSLTESALRSASS